MRQQSHVASVSLPVALALVSGGLFLLTAVVGVLVAYDRIIAFHKLVLLTVGLVLMVALPLAADSVNLRRILVLFTGVVIVAGAIVSLGEMSSSDSDATTEVLALLLPMGIGVLGITYVKSWRVGFVVSAALVVVGFGMLVALGDVSAWLALCIGVGAGSLAYLCSCTVLSPPSRWVCLLLVIGTGILLTIYIVLILVSDAQVSIVTRLPAPLADRFEIWHGVLPIVGDYRFTGSGLANSAMVYSTYLYLSHVPYLYHVHNLFLQMAVEQGIPGLIAFFGLIGASIWALFVPLCSPRRWMRIGAAALLGSMIALLTSGMLDSEIYDSDLVFMLFVPACFAWLLYRTAMTSGNDSITYRSVSWDVGLGALLPVLLTIALWAAPGGRASLYANFGAVLQTRTELSAYHWPEVGIQDQVRHIVRDSLAPAIFQYDRALQIDPNNATANRRLGQIAMSLGEYESAGRWLRSAYERQPDSRVTRYLLGEFYAIDGVPEQAIVLWQAANADSDHLDRRLWWYESSGDASLYERINATVELYGQRDR